MSKDYYAILGVDKKASKEEIKKAFRKKALEFHPDKPTGDEKKFKEINEAYSVLSDDKKRSSYDQFGGTGGFGQGPSGFEGFDFSQFSQNANSFEFDLNDILGSFFGQGFRNFRRGSDIRIDLNITFLESIQGIKKKIKFERNNGKKEELSIDIPAGIDSGEMLRLKELGEPINDGRPGDLYIRVHVEANKNFKKQGLHLLTKLEISLTEALLGSKKEITNYDNKKITIAIPKQTKHGEVLRLPGYGINSSKYRKGDLLIEISIKIPDKLSKKAKEALETLRQEGV